LSEEEQELVGSPPVRSLSRSDVDFHRRSFLFLLYNCCCIGSHDDVDGPGDASDDHSHPLGRDDADDCDHPLEFPGYSFLSIHPLVMEMMMKTTRTDIGFDKTGPNKSKQIQENKGLRACV